MRDVTVCLCARAFVLGACVRVCVCVVETKNINIRSIIPRWALRVDANLLEKSAVFMNV